VARCEDSPVLTKEVAALRTSVAIVVGEYVSFSSSSVSEEATGEDVYCRELVGERIGWPLRRRPT
jgi:hypothetical protein